MKYYSTENNSPLVSLTEAVSQGTAPDGGLYMPEHIPYIPMAFFRNINEMTLKDIAYIVIDMLLGDDLDQETVRALVNETLTFEIPLVPTNDSRIMSLEMFHGPTFTSKDIGARFMAKLLSTLGICGGDSPTRIIIAGSGNSGSAVADAFAEIHNTKTTILYPKGNLSKLQLAKIYSKPDKVLALEVRGSYDDCIAIQRTAIFDGVLGNNVRIAPANSVNIARIIPLVAVFFHLYARMTANGASPDSIVVSIPTGNLTALVSGLIAKKMGLPIKRFIAATNSNDALGRFVRNEKETNHDIIKTLANEIDIKSPSNLPRIKELYKNDINRFIADTQVIESNDESIRLGMTESFLVGRYLTDPHGGLAYTALKKGLRTGENGVFLSTFHPALYSSIVEDITGVIPDNPKNIPDLNVIPKRPLSVPPIYQAAKRIIQQFNL
ncbi:MAG: threonine synthase [Paramuribaculum sp.]|nr:threonine synthase [Paramuribaculum sp.]